MKLKILFLSITLVFAFNVSGQKRPQESQTKSTKVSPIKSNNKLSPKIFSVEVINSNIEKLPEKYCGNNIVDIANEITRRENLTKLLVKGEFETTPQFLERVKKVETENKKPLSGIFNYESIYAIETNNTIFKYDADKGLMSFEIHNYYAWLTSCHDISDRRLYLTELFNTDRETEKSSINLEPEKATLLVRFTDENPKVQAVNQKIDDLNQVRLNIKKQLREVSNQTSSTNLASLPITIFEPDSFSFNSSFKLDISNAEKIKPRVLENLCK